MFLGTKVEKIFVQSLIIQGRSAGTQRGVYQPLRHVHLILIGVPVLNTESASQSASGQSAGTQCRVYHPLRHFDIILSEVPATPLPDGAPVLHSESTWLLSFPSCSVSSPNCTEWDSRDLLSRAAELTTVRCVPFHKEHKSLKTCTTASSIYLRATFGKSHSTAYPTNAVDAAVNAPASSAPLSTVLHCAAFDESSTTLSECLPAANVNNPQLFDAWSPLYPELDQ